MFVLRSTMNARIAEALASQARNHNTLIDGMEKRHKAVVEELSAARTNAINTRDSTARELSRVQDKLKAAEAEIAALAPDAMKHRKRRDEGNASRKAKRDAAKEAKIANAETAKAPQAPKAAKVRGRAKG